MVDALLDRVNLLRDLGSQDTRGRLSRVRAINSPVDPMRRYWLRHGHGAHPLDAGAEAALLPTARLLEWSYGFRAPRHPGQRFTRRAPSAGALYPTEAYAVMDSGQGWRVHYYHFPTGRFHPVPVSNPEAIAHALGVSPGATVIVLCSVLWRTVQRYGVRGYRYCLLDAGGVAYNLLAVARLFASDLQIAALEPTEELEQGLDLRDGEVALLAFELRSPLEAIPAPVASPPTLVGQDMTPEQAPMLSPILRRTVAFHRKTLPKSVARRAVALPAAGREGYGPAWIDDRYSAKEFTAATVPAAVYRRIADSARGAGPSIYGPPYKLTVHAVRLRVEGLEAGVERLSGGGEDGASPLPAGLAERLAKACQDQRPAATCSFALVIAVNRDELVEAGHIGYRRLVIDAGLLTADLYRVAAAMSLGTTSIGGFFDDEIGSLLGDPRIEPIVIQVFGVPAETDKKEDAAQIVGGSLHRSSGPASKDGL
jgi:SagB-type dehydrogenase family enzyme